MTSKRLASIADLTGLDIVVMNNEIVEVTANLDYFF